MKNVDKVKKIIINLYPGWEAILIDLSNLFSFEICQVGTSLSNKGRLQNKYIISDISYARKSDLDNYIQNSNVGASEYARASVLYYLYACRYLTISDIKYPNYKDWKAEHQLGIDHCLPRRWFPRLTFDCTNWKPMSLAENEDKGDDFLDEGVEMLELLQGEIQELQSKYL